MIVEPDLLRSLAARSDDVRAALAACMRADEQTLADQCELARIPAPTGHERARADWMARGLRRAGLTDVHIDEVGNVLGWLTTGVGGSAGVGGLAGARPAIALAAHLDTVFDAATPVRLAAHDDGLIVGPGICDDARGLAALLTLARVLRQALLTFSHPLLFVATVGEEGAGDLRGVRHLFSPAGALAAGCAGFISLDGAGVEPIVNQGPGARRWRVTMSGPGGHSWSDAGVPNPMHGLSRAIAALDAHPRPPGTTLSVGRWGGGTSVNAIPTEAWCEIEVRALDERRLDTLATTVEDSIRAHAATVSDAGSGARLAVSLRSLGVRPAGATAPDAALVRAALTATRALGVKPRLAAASTDSNLPMSLGIPAVTLGAGGEGGAAHTEHEWYRNTDGPLGVARALLTLLLADLH